MSLVVLYVAWLVNWRVLHYLGVRQMEGVMAIERTRFACLRVSAKDTRSAVYRLWMLPTWWKAATSGRNIWASDLSFTCMFLVETLLFEYDLYARLPTTLWALPCYFWASYWPCVALSVARPEMHPSYTLFASRYSPIVAWIPLLAFEFACLAHHLSIFYVVDIELESLWSPYLCQPKNGSYFIRRYSFPNPLLA